MSITYYSANQILAYNFGKATYTVPNTFYFGLSKSPISIDGTGVLEPSTVGTGYARVACVNYAGADLVWGSPSNAALTNIKSIQFAESLLSWDIISHVFLADASTGGNIWYYEALPISKTVQSQTTVLFAIGAVTISMTNS